MTSSEIHLLGKPRPKARPKAFRTAGGAVRIYTPSSGHEKAVAVELSLFKGMHTGLDSLYVAMRFYGADKRSDLDNLCKLMLDALVKACVIDDDRKIAALFLERSTVRDGRNKFPGKPSTSIEIGEWDAETD